MKKFIKELRTNKLADKTVTLVVTLVRSIIRSVRDDQGNPVFTMQYDANFIDLPEVRKRDQKTPSITREQLEAAIASEDETALFLIFLASSGLRVGEALAVRPGNLQDEVSHHWAGTVYVRTQQRGGPLKTDAARRDVEYPRKFTIILPSTSSRENIFFPRKKPGIGSASRNAVFQDFIPRVDSIGPSSRIPRRRT
jgi:integrase